MVVPDAILANGELLKRGLLHEMKAVGIAVEKRDGSYFDVRFRKLLASSKTLLLDRSIQQILQSRPYHRARAARRRRGEEDIQYLIRLAIDFDQQFLFELIGSDEWHTTIVTRGCHHKDTETQRSGGPIKTNTQYQAARPLCLCVFVVTSRLNMAQKFQVSLVRFTI